MTAANPALKHFSQLLIFILCDENEEEFAKQVGLGSGAALLQQRNMLSLFSKLKPTETKDKEDSDSEEEEIKKANEAEEVAIKLQKLQDLGFIKIVKEHK